MSTLQNSELRRIETKYPEGISSAAVVKIFQQKGERFSEATLRKYVQLGLLPTSRRVGIRGTPPRVQRALPLHHRAAWRTTSKRPSKQAKPWRTSAPARPASLGEIELLRRASPTKPSNVCRRR